MMTVAPRPRGRRRHTHEGPASTMTPSDPEEVLAPPPRRAGEVRRVKVSELLAGEREAILEHGGQEYRLRITASGKLILTK
jgi:hemin uptake protein HemP